LEASAACAVPWLAAKGHVLSALLQLLPDDVLSLAAQIKKWKSVFSGSIQSVKIEGKIMVKILTEQGVFRL